MPLDLYYPGVRVLGRRGRIGVVTPIFSGPTTWWVSSTGNNNNDGLSLGSAFATIARAEQSAQPGDVIQVRGTFGPQTFSLSGTPTLPITYDGGGRMTFNIFGNGAWSPLPQATFDGTGGGQTGDVLLMSGRSNVIIQGFRVQDASRAGIWVTGRNSGESTSSTNITIRHCQVDGTQQAGIACSGLRPFNLDLPTGDWEKLTNLLIELNEVTRTNLDGTPPLNEIISIKNGVRFFTVRWNWQHHSGQYAATASKMVEDGEIYENHSHNVGRGTYVYGGTFWVRRINVTRNYHHNSFGGIVCQPEVFDTTAQPIDIEDITIADNIVHDTQRFCISIGRSTVGNDASINSFQRIKVINNNVWRGGTNASEPGGGINISALNNGLIECRNNVIWQTLNGKPVFVNSAGAVDTNNLKDTVDPQWADPTNHDFSFSATSPLLNAGTAQGISAFDFFGNQRLVGPAPDVGAIERPN